MFCKAPANNTRHSDPRAPPFNIKIRAVLHSDQKLPKSQNNLTLRRVSAKIMCCFIMFVNRMNELDVNDAANLSF